MVACSSAGALPGALRRGLVLAAGRQVDVGDHPWLPPPAVLISLTGTPAGAYAVCSAPLFSRRGFFEELVAGTALEGLTLDVAASTPPEDPPQSDVRVDIVRYGHTRNCVASAHPPAC